MARRQHADTLKLPTCYLYLHLPHPFYTNLTMKELKIRKIDKKIAFSAMNTRLTFSIHFFFIQRGEEISLICINCIAVLKMIIFIAV
jgi:hypothetical protein